MIKIDTLQNRISEMKGDGLAPIIIWGTGERAKGTVPHLYRNGIVPVCFCDSDERKWGKTYYFDGGSGEILSPEQCREKYPDATYIICTAFDNLPFIKKAILQNNSSCNCFHCCYPFKVDPEFLTINNDEIKLLENMEAALADELSRKVFRASLNYKTNGNIEPLAELIDGDYIFDDILLDRYKSDETFINCGAYTGDTMIRFLEFCRGKYGSIRLYDGDRNNCNWMKKLVGLTRLSNVSVHEELLWDKCEELEFYTFDIDSDDYVYENGDVSSWRNKNACSRKIEKLQKLGSYTGQKKMAYRLDEIIPDDERVGMIKIVVVGSDMNVLKGCEKILKSRKPAIVVEWAACKRSDVWEMIPFIKECNSEYKIYLRQKKQHLGTKTMLYAI